MSRPTIGVLLAEGPAPAWAAAAVEQLAREADVVRLEPPSATEAAPVPALARWVDRFVTGETSTALAPSAAVQRVPPSDGRGLDVVIDLAGDGAVAPARAARGTLVLGIDGRRGHQALPGRDRSVRRSLELRRPDGTWAPAGEAVQRRDPVSLARTTDAALWSSPGLLKVAMARLAHDGTLECSSCDGRVDAGRFMPLAAEVLRAAWRRAALSERRERWHLVVRLPAPDAFTPVTAAEAAGAVAAPGRHWADPFVTEFEGRVHVVFEDARAGGLGRIAAAAVGPDGRLGPSRTVLERPYHLSYPFLLRHGGRTYMVPESGDNRTVDLYELLGDPPEAVHRATLLDGLTALDPTIVEAGGRLRLFVFVVTDGRTAGELHLFSADALEGPWQPHPRNPVVTDACTARPGGGLLRIDGRLLRPAQSSIPRYGGHVTLQEVLRLDDEGYAERPWMVLRSRGLLGQHHLHRAGDLEVLDVLLRDPPLHRLRRRRR